MTQRRTEPRITDEQNSAGYLRLLSAQRQLYAEVKRSSHRRLALVVLTTIAALVLGAFIPTARNYLGGVAALAMGIWVCIADLRERASVDTASGIQEEFDTGLFRLRWHDHLANHPSDWAIADAAQRGSLDGLRNWYQPKTISDIVRPLDVLICQRANLDYGVSLHKSYSRTLTIVLSAAVVAAFAVGGALGYSVWNFIFGITAPLAPAGFAIVGEIQSHRESASNKQAAESKVADLWRRGLVDPTTITDEDCRGAQDRILCFRQTNARVPEWWYERVRDQNEAVMLATCSALVDEALGHGHGLT
jgi:SMODS-associating 4TM effector domain